MSPTSRDRHVGNRRRVMPSSKYRPKKAGQKPCKGKVRFPSREFAEAHAATLRGQMDEPKARRDLLHAYLCRYCSTGERAIFHVGHRRLTWDRIPTRPPTEEES